MGKLIVFVAALFLMGCRPPYETRIKNLCGLSRAFVTNEPFIAYGLAKNINIYATLRSCRNHAFRLVYSGDKFKAPMSFMRPMDDLHGKFTVGLISGSFKESESRELYIEVLSIDPVRKMDIDEGSWEEIKHYNDHQFMRLVIKG